MYSHQAIVFKHPSPPAEKLIMSNTDVLHITYCHQCHVLHCISGTHPHKQLQIVYDVLHIEYSVWWFTRFLRHMAAAKSDQNSSAIVLQGAAVSDRVEASTSMVNAETASAAIPVQPIPRPLHFRYLVRLQWFLNVNHLLLTRWSSCYSAVPLQSDCSAWCPFSWLLHWECDYIECHFNKKTAVPFFDCACSLVCLYHAAYTGNSVSI